MLALFGLGNLDIFLSLVSGSRFVASGSAGKLGYFWLRPPYLAVTCLLLLPVVC